MAEERALKVSRDHIWVGLHGQQVLLGLTNYGQGELGRILSVEFPEIGDEVERGEPFGEVESVDTVAELIAPVSGKVLAVNHELEARPSLINEDPYHEGWLVEVKIRDESEIDDLMDMDEYYHFVFRPRS
jgi:glycine cleavage system H protein